MTFVIKMSLLACYSEFYFYITLMRIFGEIVFKMVLIFFS